MFKLHETLEFSLWLERLRDREARSRIQVRLQRLRLGLFGDSKPVGEGVGELRIDYGPGYRVYFIRQGAELIVLLCGGDKRRQQQDIARAIDLARGLK
ncbi:type II toxin-antitoxin system RelE/ParE family toxin [Ferrovibrio sp.]|uniref:type II toxin-antitoxin system RelE/ParE family toxin n=1 Tax=Ferrovibrio sp. TaxID=1917215 RepID=UPI0025BEF638|nr:type II toxin-antitoxin system RelE/ParE family toxin [Ferrovibrio sp.]MBX3455328.1 type II toxin-antitoxin system RelE/ParE family toxin [Ferrovibrio sp.]